MKGNIFKGNKVLKVILITLGYVVGFIVLLAIFAQFILEVYINSETGNKKINEIASEYIDAKIDFKKVRLHIWNDLPNIGFELDKTALTGKEFGENFTDTILTSDTLRLTINMIELLKYNNVIVKDAYMSRPIANLHVDANGKSNWDIFKSDSTPDEDTSSFSNKIHIERLFIDNLKVNYYDESTQTIASLDSTDIEISGEISSGIISIDTRLCLNAKYNDGSSQIIARAKPSEISIVGYMDNYDLLQPSKEGSYNINAKLGGLSAKLCDQASNTGINIGTINLELQTKITDSSYNLNTAKLNLLLSEYYDNDIKITNIPLNLNLKAKSDAELKRFDVDKLNVESKGLTVDVSGVIEKIDTSSWNTDVAIGVKIPDLGTAKSIIPQNYTTELELNRYKIDGSINFNGKAKGTYNDYIYPEISANLALNNISLKLDTSAQSHTADDSIYTNNLLKLVQKLDDVVKLDMETDFKYNSQNDENSYINIKHLNASVGKNQLDFNGTISNISDNQNIDATLNCNLEIEQISKILNEHKFFTEYKCRGKLSLENTKIKSSLDDLMNLDISKVYILGGINAEMLLIEKKDSSFSIFAKRASSNWGINTQKMTNADKTVLTKLPITFDTLRIKNPDMEIRASKLKFGVHTDTKDIGSHVNIEKMYAILADTKFISSKEVKMQIRMNPDKTDTLAKCITTSVILDSIIYYDPYRASSLDSTQIEFNVRSGLDTVLFNNDGEPNAFATLLETLNFMSDSTKRKSFVQELENPNKAKEYFKLSGALKTKHIKYISKYDTTAKIGIKDIDLTFAEDTFCLRNTFLRVDNSVVKINGRLEHLLPYLKDTTNTKETLKGNLNIYSKNIDIDHIRTIIYKIDSAKNIDKNLQNLKLTENDYFEGKIPKTLKASLKTHYKDSIRKNYLTKDFGEIFKERLGSMYKIFEEARIEDSEERKRNSPYFHVKGKDNNVYLPKLPIYTIIRATNDNAYYCLPSNKTTRNTKSTSSAPPPDMSIVEIPANLNISVNVKKIDTLKFEGITMNYLNGNVILRDSTLLISIKELLAPDIIEHLHLNVIYKACNKDTAQLDVGLIGTEVSLESLMNIPDVDQLVIDIDTTFHDMLVLLKGNADCELKAKTYIDKNMDPIMPSLKTTCRIDGYDLKLKDNKTFYNIARYFLFKGKEYKDISLSSIEFAIDDSKLNFYPFSLATSNHKAAISGIMNLNDNYPYDFHISLVKGFPIPLGLNVKTKETKETEGVRLNRYIVNNAANVHTLRDANHYIRNGVVKIVSTAGDTICCYKPRTILYHNNMDKKNFRKHITPRIVIKPTDIVYCNCEIVEEDENQYRLVKPLYKDDNFDRNNCDSLSKELDKELKGVKNRMEIKN